MPQRVLQVVSLVLVLILFFVSIELIGDSFKLMGEGFAETLIRTTANPFVGLFIGILATSLVQSSSTVTSMVVLTVAGGGLTVAGAIPIVMGANIGTSVTNTIVSLGHITRKDEFRRAMAGATVHDFFNLMAVAILFPLELATQWLSTLAYEFEEVVLGLGGVDFLSPVKVITDPIANFVVGLAGENGVAVLVLGLLCLFIALRYLVKLLRALLLGQSEALIHKYVFGHPALAIFFGVLITVMVQSSSITTSVMVPLVGAGIVTVHQIFPFVLGANIGTTITSILAASAAIPVPFPIVAKPAIRAEKTDSGSAPRAMREAPRPCAFFGRSIPALRASCTAALAIWPTAFTRLLGPTCSGSGCRASGRILASGRMTGPRAFAISMARLPSLPPAHFTRAILPKRYPGSRACNPLPACDIRPRTAA